MTHYISLNSSLHSGFCDLLFKDFLPLPMTPLKLFNCPQYLFPLSIPFMARILYILLILTLKYQLSLLRQVKEIVDIITDDSLVLTDGIPEPGFLLMESFWLEGASTVANRSYPTKSTLKDISSMYFLAAFITCIIECQSVVGIEIIKANRNLSKNYIQNNTLRISTIEGVW